MHVLINDIQDICAHERTIENIKVISFHLLIKKEIYLGNNLKNRVMDNFFGSSLRAKKRTKNCVRPLFEKMDADNGNNKWTKISVDRCDGKTIHGNGRTVTCDGKEKKTEIG